MLNNKKIKLMKKFTLTTFQKQLLIGILLGDAHLETNSKNRTTFRLKIEQSDSHKDYLFYLYDSLKDFCGTGPRQRANGNWVFSTYKSVSFRFYALYFYNAEGKKRIPRNIGRFLTPTSLAFWYMDDGSIKSKQSKGVILNTQCYLISEINLLVEVLYKKFGLIAKPRKQKEGYQIYISGHSFTRFCELVLPFVHDSMLYKIPSARKSRNVS